MYLLFFQGFVVETQQLRLVLLAVNLIPCGCPACS